MKYHKKHCAGQGKGVGGDCRRREKSLFPALCTKGACLVSPKSHGPSMGLGWQPQLGISEVGEVRVSWRWTCEQGHVQCGSSQWVDSAAAMALGAVRPCAASSPQDCEP